MGFVLSQVTSCRYKFMGFQIFFPSQLYYAQGTQSFSGRLPALGRKLRFQLFFSKKYTHSTKDLKPKLRNFPQVSREPQSKFEANRSKGPLVNVGQTNNQRLQLYLFRCLFYSYRCLFYSYKMPLLFIDAKINKTLIS